MTFSFLYCLPCWGSHKLIVVWCILIQLEIKKVMTTRHVKRRLLFANAQTKVFWGYDFCIALLLCCLEKLTSQLLYAVREFESRKQVRCQWQGTKDNISKDNTIPKAQTAAIQRIIVIAFQVALRFEMFPKRYVSTWGRIYLINFDSTNCSNLDLTIWLSHNSVIWESTWVDCCVGSKNWIRRKVWDFNVEEQAFCINRGYAILTLPAPAICRIDIFEVLLLFHWTNDTVVWCPGVKLQERSEMTRSRDRVKGQNKTQQ